MSILWDVIFPSIILSSNQKHCNSANPYAGYEMLTAPHLEIGDRILTVARVRLYENAKGSNFVLYDKEFRPEIYKNCRDADEKRIPNRNFWYFEEIDIQRRGKITDLEYQRLIGAVHVLHKVIPTRRQRSVITVNASLGSLYAEPTKKRNLCPILEKIEICNARLFDLIDRAYKSYN
jgi:hypothetical protein